MIQLLEQIPDLIIPLILAGVAIHGAVQRVDVYDGLITGAQEGLQVMLHILPALIILMSAVSMFRVSGAFELASDLAAPLLNRVGIPPELFSLMLVRPISGSAALGIGSELIHTYGPDSDLGRTAAVMLGSTETTFYTIAVYFGSIGIRRTRYAIPAALLADFTGFLSAAWAVRLLFA